MVYGFHVIYVPNKFPFTDLGKLDCAYFTNLLIDLLVFWYQVLARLHEAGFHVDIDISDRTIQKKVLPCSHSLLPVSFGFLYLFPHPY